MAPLGKLLHRTISKIIPLDLLSIPKDIMSAARNSVPEKYQFKPFEVLDVKPLEWEALQKSSGSIVVLYTSLSATNLAIPPDFLSARAAIFFSSESFLVYRLLLLLTLHLSQRQAQAPCCTLFRFLQKNLAKLVK